MQKMQADKLIEIFLQDLLNFKFLSICGLLQARIHRIVLNPFKIPQFKKMQNDLLTSIISEQISPIIEFLSGCH